MKGLAQKLKDLKPAKGKKLTNADVQKAYDDVWCGAQKQQEELDAREGSMKVTPDELDFKIGGATQNYTKDCRSKP